MRERRIGAEELLDSVLDRSKSVEPDVRAFVTITEDRARHDARQAQHVLDEHGAHAPPLTGVPMAVKDLLDVAGVPTTAASRVLAGNVPKTDSAVWSALRAQGATLLGKTNTHEFAYGGATEPTRNPWDLARIAGGSSGGSAAALAAGMCHAALGTDTAGSIRIPAALCGVSGLKPTRAAVCNDGVVPLSPTLDVVGPMARTPDDVRWLFAAMRGRPTPTAHQGDTVRGLRVGVVRPQGPIDPGVLTGLEAGSAELRAAGARVESVELHLDLVHAAAVNFTIMGAEAAAYHREWLRTRPGDYSLSVRTRLGEAGQISEQAYAEALASRPCLTQQVETCLDGLDVLMLNSVPCTASPAYDTEVAVGGQIGDRDTVLCRDLAFANVTGHPALHVPTGLSGGLPVGVQLVGRAGEDDGLFGAGQLLFDQLAAIPV